MRANRKRNKRIFRIANGTVQIYGFEPINSELALFRLKEMQSIPEDEQIIYEEPTRMLFPQKKGVLFDCESYVIVQRPIRTEEERDARTLLLKKYTRGLLGRCAVHVRTNAAKGRQVIYLNPKDRDPDKKLQLTRDLYLAHLLENERFADENLQAVLEEEGLEQFRPLFHITSDPLAEASLDSLEAFISSGIIKGDFEDRKDFLESSTKVYEKLKRN